MSHFLPALKMSEQTCQRLLSRVFSCAFGKWTWPRQSRDTVRLTTHRSEPALAALFILQQSFRICRGALWRYQEGNIHTAIFDLTFALCISSFFLGAFYLIYSEDEEMATRVAAQIGPPVLFWGPGVLGSWTAFLFWDAARREVKPQIDVGLAIVSGISLVCWPLGIWTSWRTREFCQAAIKGNGAVPATPAEKRSDQV